jgi:hypothetical protein
MFTLNCFDENDGIPIAKIVGTKKEDLLCISKEDNSEDSDALTELELSVGKFEPRLNPYQRSVVYIAGPSGSGKSTYAANLIRSYLKFLKKDFFVFSRTDCRIDPAFKGMKMIQITIDNALIDDPIDITQEITNGALILFDDCNTIQDEKLKKAVEKIMEDILEVGRKLDITILITSHLVIPTSKNFARTIMNELQSLTVFPKSGSAQQIRYALKTYFGLSNKQIDDILSIKSRWITISKTYPMYVLSDKIAYIL